MASHLWCLWVSCLPEALVQTEEEALDCLCHTLHILSTLANFHMYKTVQRKNNMILDLKKKYDM